MVDPAGSVVLVFCAVLYFNWRLTNTFKLGSYVQVVGPAVVSEGTLDQGLHQALLRKGFDPTQWEVVEGWPPPAGFERSMLPVQADVTLSNHVQHTFRICVRIKRKPSDGQVTYEIYRLK